ncbi:hypothetical protein L6164_010231 [Bauhinia variegata]|uniref:Uncharacterized protein n=1 Tax=Bauhinia variegata TaxID=167791 RepID=A0ACB9PMJ8_BAUVA|nr:hypothetical protein L6164_010231 [Bauhinia variegata]
MKLQHFQCFVGFARAPSIPIAYVRPSSFSISTSKRKFCVSALKITDNEDSLLLSASSSVYLRYQETIRSEPLFVDPFAGCIIPPDVEIEVVQHVHPYCLATKFIDDKLLRTVSHIDGVKQVVLLTDGMDTRPYRISWPASTIIFDVSPERAFNIASEKLQDVGAKIPRSCLFFHIPSESSSIQQSLQLKGFNGTRPSIWALQGFPIMTLSILQDILLMVSSLAMKDSYFIGELPARIANTKVGINVDTRQWMEKLFMSFGFRVEIVSFEGVARSLNKELASRHCDNILFVAEKLRFSDDQMETWNRELQRIEDEGDEEGFEEL